MFAEALDFLPGHWPSSQMRVKGFLDPSIGSNKKWDFPREQPQVGSPRQQ